MVKVGYACNEYLRCRYVGRFITLVIVFGVMGWPFVGLFDHCTRFLLLRNDILNFQRLKCGQKIYILGSNHFFIHPGDNFFHSDA